jgi:hypothetical protein
LLRRRYLARMSRNFVKAPAILIALIVAWPAFACPPALPDDPPPPSRAELVRSAAERSPNIVYAVVERAIGAYRSGEQRRLIRILHVYKGELRVGQRLWMNVRGGGSECAPGQPAEITALEGDDGVLLLPAYREGGEPLALPEFLDAKDANDLIRAGIIRSARDGSAAKPVAGGS